MPTKAPTHRAANRPTSADYDRGRGADRQFYSTQRWRRFRLWYLAQPGNALCVDCQAVGRVTPAVELDHRQDRRAFPDLAFVEQNIDGLCKSHHSRRSMRRRQGAAQ